MKREGKLLTPAKYWNHSEFYKNLYTSGSYDATYNDLFFEDANLAKLDQIAQDKLEEPLLVEECYNVLKQSAKGKCPGSDGLSVEFYLHFWPLLGEEMIQSSKYALDQGKINITQRQGVIKVKPKKKKG